LVPQPHTMDLSSPTGKIQMAVSTNLLDWSTLQYTL
jgi:hypothetical protein